MNFFSIFLRVKTLSRSSYLFCSLLRISFQFCKIEHHDVTELCHPSPCGLNSQCRVVNEHVVCSCLPNFIGSAPNCRPECMISSECAQNRACINNRCVDPCIGTCGQHARCNVVNHNPICSCSPGYTGDPFIRCLVQRKCMSFCSEKYSIESKNSKIKHWNISIDYFTQC